MSRPAEPPGPPSKLEVMRALLEHAEAQVHLDARKRGVELPERLRGSSNVRLDYGYGLVPPIPDLRVDEDGIRATLSFNRVPYATFVPWDAIFLIADFAGRGAVWREDLPPELTADLTTPSEADTATGTPSSARITEREIPSPRRFTVLDGDEPKGTPRRDAERDESEPPSPEPPRPRPALRLVK